MKTFVYTVSDFSPFAEHCINLLFSNIITEPDIEYCVITNNKPSSKFQYNTLHVDFNGNYVGFLKYYPKLPAYDRYVYLDSDILYFDRISKLFNNNYEHTIMKEADKLLIDQWCSYHIPDKSSLNSNVNGLNAGMFTFKTTEILENITHNLQQYTDPGYHPSKNARLEQSLYNHFIGKKYNYDWNQCHDVTNIAKLAADADTVKCNTKTLYHFSGNNHQANFNPKKLHMFYKCRRMQIFLQNNFYRAV